MSAAFHVIPLNDLREHVGEEECWCNPVEMFDGDSIVWVHNSMDRRELTIERGRVQ